MENNYDTRILDSRIAFQLLKTLVDLGDVKAKSVFKSEIIKRFTSGWPPTIIYLIEQDYLDYFNDTEQEMLFNEIKKGIIKTFKNNNDLPLVKLLIDKGFIYLLEDKEKENNLFIRALREKCLNLLETQKDFRTYDDYITANLSYFSTPDQREAYYVKRYNWQPDKDVALPIEKLVKWLILKGYFGALTINDVKFHPKLQLIERLYLNRKSDYFDFYTLPKNISLMNSLKVLELREMRIRKLPNSYCNFTSLELLDLERNNIKTLPECLGDLHNLRTLFLYKNKLEKLPESIGGLRHIERLILSDNKIKVLPESIKELKNLKILSLSNNDLIKIPPQVFEISNLKELHLLGNRLNELPKKISNLKNLEILDLSDNKLHFIPREIENLKLLKTLNLRQNKLNKNRVYSLNVFEKDSLINELMKDGNII